MQCCWRCYCRKQWSSWRDTSDDRIAAFSDCPRLPCSSGHPTALSYSQFDSTVFFKTTPQFSQAPSCLLQTDDPVAWYVCLSSGCALQTQLNGARSNVAFRFPHIRPFQFVRQMTPHSMRPLLNYFRHLLSVVSVGPVEVCDDHSCANSGQCIQEWSYYRCDCDMTSFTGDTCTEGQHTCTVRLTFSHFLSLFRRLSVDDSVTQWLASWLAKLRPKGSRARRFGPAPRVTSVRRDCFYS